MQKKATKKDEAAFTATGAGNSEARAAAKKAKAMLRSIRPLGLKALRNKILRDAIKQFEKDNGWVNGSLASSKTGSSVRVSDKRAISFCSIGAIKKAGRDDRTSQQAAVYAIVDSLPDDYYLPYRIISEYGLREASVVVNFNDNFSEPKPIIDVFKRALNAPIRKEARK